MRNIGSTTSALALAALAAACTPPEQAPPEVEYLMSDATRELGLPFSDAVRIGNLMFLSGQIGNLPGTLKLAEGGIEAESRQVLENIRTVLERHGASMRDIVKCTVFIDDIAEWPRFNEVYVTFFDENLPARSALGADGLALGAKVEVECIAVVGRE